MTPQYQERVAREALQYATPGGAWLVAAQLAWTTLNLGLCVRSNLWILVFPALQLWIWTLIFPKSMRHRLHMCYLKSLPEPGAYWSPMMRVLQNREILTLFWAPAIALWMLPIALRNRCPLSKVLLAEILLPARRWPLPHALTTPGQLIYLDSGRILGTHHAVLDDMARRSARQQADITALQTRTPGAIVLSDYRRQVLVSRMGEILGLQRLPTKGRIIP